MTDPSRSGYRPLDAPRRERQLGASVPQQVGAGLLDAVVAFVMVPVPISVTFMLTGRSLVRCAWNTPTAPIGDIVEPVESCVLSPGDARLSRVMFWLLAVVFVMFHSWMTTRRRTWGQRAAGIAVVEHATGERVGFGRALVRTVVAIPGALVLGVGFWWALRDPDRRALHDRVAGTRSISP